MTADRQNPNKADGESDMQKPNIPELTKQISLRFPEDSSDMNGRFRHSSVYRLLCEIIGVEPGQSELIYLAQYLFHHSGSKYLLTREEKRVKCQLVRTLDYHQCELIPFLANQHVQNEVRQVYVMSLSKNNPRRQELKVIRRERHEKYKSQKRSLAAHALFSLDYLLNHKSDSSWNGSCMDCVKMLCRMTVFGVVCEFLSPF